MQEFKDPLNLTKLDENTSNVYGLIEEIIDEYLPKELPKFLIE